MSRMFTLQLRGQIWTILGIGILVRIFLALTTFHPDIRAFNLGGQLVASGNILNLYDYLASCTIDNPLVKTFGTDLFIYPPAVYLYHGVFNFIFSIFSPQIENGFLIDNASVFGNPFFNLHLLLLKTPYFIFDLTAAFLLSKLFDSKRNQLLAFALWMFNPVNLYATYMMGQFDVIPVCFTILSLFFIKKGKYQYAALALGIGAAFKIYPLLLLVPLVFIEKDWKRRIELGLLGILPYIITVAPFLPSAGFRSSALIAGLTEKSLVAQIPISGGESLILYPLFLLSFYLVLFYSRGRNELWKNFLIVLLIFFIFTHYHPQWFLWLTPFLIIELINSNFKHWFSVLLIVVTFIIGLFFFDQSLTTGIFAPLFPVLYSLPTIWQLLDLNIGMNFTRSILQTIFAAVSIYYIAIYFPKVSKE